MKKLNTYIASLLLFLSTGSVMAQQTPAPKQTKGYSIEGATAHLGNGKVIENSLIMFNNGKITFVGSANQKIARTGTVINAQGKHVYPGFIAANSSLGLAEIDAVRATNDSDEIGPMLPHIRSIIAYNTESLVVESVRPNGVLIAEIVPRGGTISGTSSVMQLDAWNWEDAAIKVDAGIHMNWPQRAIGSNSGFGNSYQKNIQSIKDYFLAGKRYVDNSPAKKNLAFEAMKGLFNGTQRLLIHAKGQREITDAINTAKSAGIDKIVIVNGEEAHKVIDLLKEHNVPVIVDRSHRVPDNEDDDFDLSYRTAKTLMDNGIIVAIGMEGQMERMNTRNLPFYAGTYAAYGVPTEKAVQMITGNAAKILGVDDITGTLEKGKDATLFICEGDALDMRTNIISKAFIQGRDISLETHQTTLWKRYAKKLKSK